MKNFILSLTVLMSGLGASGIAFAGGAHEHGGHEHHVKHNMVLYGFEQTFVSHIVFNAPHNYQVILKVNFDPATLEGYRTSRTKYPQARFIYLLDEMHIGDIEHLGVIQGTIFRVGEDGMKVVVARDVRVERRDFEIVYFNELPLSLAP